MCVEIATITQLKHKSDRRRHYADTVSSDQVAMLPRLRQDRRLGQKAFYFILQVYNNAAVR